MISRDKEALINSKDWELNWGIFNDSEISASS
jgi:hypothetical protein